MSTHDPEEWLTGHRAKMLLRLYLAWPSRFETDSGREASSFFTWLQSNYNDLAIVNQLSGPDDIAEFLRSNPEVIEAAKFLKPKAIPPSNNNTLRGEERVRTTTQVFFGVYECEEAPALVGHSIKGSVIDVTRGGIGIEIHQPIPIGSILNLTVAPANLPITLYRVTGEIRWVRESIGLYQLGILIFDQDDAGRWRKDFDFRFLRRPTD